MPTKPYTAAIRRLGPGLLAGSAVLASAAAFANHQIAAGALRFTSHSASFGAIMGVQND